MSRTSWPAPDPHAPAAVVPLQYQWQVEALADLIAGEDVGRRALGERAAVAQEQGVGGAGGEFLQAARLAARRRTHEDVTAMEAALEGRRAAATADADIAFHAAVLAAAHNPVLADLFTQFTPVLRTGLVDLLALTGLRAHDPNTADEVHEALVRAVADGDAEAAVNVVRKELEDPFGG
ncbi:FCD domain-containing protein [Streptomyces sp. NBC_00005]|uniref:FCD domain-containing protein n=1 Tax=Streptomyces sp. NBC_00005 TaxID=2903609 RepID=UPI00324B19BD